jgi:hypothetical protein
MIASLIPPLDTIVQAAYKLQKPKTMKVEHKTVAAIEVSGKDVTIKSRPEEGTAGGWAVIAFTPACSLRSQKIHREEDRRRFAEAVCVACGSTEPEDIDNVENAILDITIDPPDA